MSALGKRIAGCRLGTVFRSISQVKPTVYSDLNTVLSHFVACVRSNLADNFCGAYLQGSFALGDADRDSDVDFLIVTDDDVSTEQLDALQAMHSMIYELDVPWAQHLEGSYVPKAKLRRIDPLGHAFLYLNNGSSRLVWDKHCNTAVMRWILREHGLVLEGPLPETLVDPVSATELRHEALSRLREYAEWAREPIEAPMSRWKQPYLVLTFCRLLNTFSDGRVVTKREAGEWAMGTLDPEWAPVIRRALQDRANPWNRVHQTADPDLVGRTLAFADYALRRLSPVQTS
jgi:Aminoglycoside adenylyltransferase, C-terminal domain/Nucleotidyltransferase domain